MSKALDELAEEYLVLSIKWSGKHNEKYATWYRENGNGYVWSIDHAGIYTKEDAEERNHNCTIAIPKKLALELSVLDDFEKTPAHYLHCDKIEELRTLSQQEKES